MTLLKYCQENNIVIKTPIINIYEYLIFWRILKGLDIGIYIYPFGFEKNLASDKSSSYNYLFLCKLKKKFKQSKIKMANELSLMMIMSNENNYNNFKINDDFWCYLDNDFEWKIIPRNEWKKKYIETRLKQYDNLLKREEFFKELNDKDIDFNELIYDEYDETKEDSEDNLKTYFNYDENTIIQNTLKQRRENMSNDYVFC